MLSFINNGSVVLKSVTDQKTIIAIGYFVRLDVKEEVRGWRLGSNWFSVNVHVVVKQDEPLMRPYLFFENISDVLGAAIAWPCYLVNILN